MVNEQVRLFVLVDIDFEVAVIVVSGGSHDDRVGLTNRKVFFFFFAVREGLWEVVTVVLLILIVLVHVIVTDVVVSLAECFSLHFGKLSSEDRDVIFVTTIILDAHIL